ncbi:F-box protein At5g52880 isoform X2 [Elaeis guineensis]|uniref:F-box protein At5g52880 isoform X2 n=1 Tax=Elaeis guineensis var. tenera TaxID=51953 RepID=UPI003C6CDC76
MTNRWKERRGEMGGATPSERYEELGLAEALLRPYDYPTACRELGLILRLAYGKLSKGLQSIVFRDTLSAFRLLPQVQTGNGISSANILLQAAEVVLPKQKKALAVSEFKHAVVAHKRRSRAHEDGGSMQLPHDVLVHIFSFLDMRSLVTASSVCWAWNSAASDGTLWQLQYSLLFGEYDVSCLQTGKLVQVKDVVFHQGIECVDATFYAMTNLNWKEAYRRKYLDTQPSMWSPYNIEGTISYMAVDVVIIKEKNSTSILDANIQHGSM